MCGSWLSNLMKLCYQHCFTDDYTIKKKSLCFHPVVDKKYKGNQSKVFYLPVKLASILQILLQQLSFTYSKADPVIGTVILAKPGVCLVIATVAGQERGRMKGNPKLVQSPSLCNLQIGLEGAFHVSYGLICNRMNFNNTYKKSCLFYMCELAQDNIL